MRLRAKVDKNQPKIIKTLRQLGVSAVSTANLGDGFPDIIVGFRGANYLFEIKNPDMPPSQRQLTDDEKKWHEQWKGQKAVVETIGEIFAIIGLSVGGYCG